MPVSRNKRKNDKKKDKPRKQKSAPVVLPDRRVMEGWMRTELFGNRGGRGAADEAQALLYDAWETPDRRRRITMAKEALALWPDCADAWVMLAEEAATTVEEAGEFYLKGVEAGERTLGERAFREDAGHFWGLLETRPYMRARAGLAQVLEELQREDDAIEHYREMLRLNPNDNQGIRYLLLRLLVALNRDDEAWALLHEHDEALAAWAYTRALLAFRRGEDASSLLQEAFQRNQHVPAYLLGRRRLPARMPEYVGLGDQDEAVAYAAAYLSIWRQTLGALEWLKEAQP
jgi:tetratricopeptide (TPR) repeat protein